MKSILISKPEKVQYMRFQRYQMWCLNLDFSKRFDFHLIFPSQYKQFDLELYRGCIFLPARYPSTVRIKYEAMRRFFMWYERFVWSNRCKIDLLTAWNFPLNILIPIMANINQKITQTTRTLKISGKAPTKAFTTTFIPSIFAIALNGRKALSVLIVWNIIIFKVHQIVRCLWYI